jgi:hypothetical protein
MTDELIEMIKDALKNTFAGMARCRPNISRSIDGGVDHVRRAAQKRDGEGNHLDLAVKFGAERH